MPSEHFRPIRVPEEATDLEAYSTWKIRPSGENVVGDRSYCGGRGGRGGGGGGNVARV